MQEPKFEDFFQKARKEIPIQPDAPRGDWILVCRATVKRNPREEGKSGQVSFIYELVEPTENVNPTDLEAFAASGASIKDNRPTADFWTKGWKDINRVWDFVAMHGVDVDEYGDLDAALKACHNKKVLGEVFTEVFVHAVKGPQSRDKVKNVRAIQ